jgi:hypothetical protein
MITAIVKRPRRVRRATIKRVVGKVFAEAYSDNSAGRVKDGVIFHKKKPTGIKAQPVYGFRGKILYAEIVAKKGTKGYKDYLELLSNSLIKPKKKSTKKQISSKKSAKSKRKTALASKV